MGTRSTIALEYADGTVDQIYCHWDGYLDHNGRILLNNYSDPFKLRELMDLGDMSSLGPTVGAKHDFDIKAKYGTPEYLAESEAKSQMCTFYGRDRGEDGVGAKRFKDFEDYKANHQYEEYEYILRQVEGKPVWFVSSYDTGGYITLAEAFEAEKEMV
jgi:hypothetical protein